MVVYFADFPSKLEVSRWTGSAAQELRESLGATKLVLSECSSSTTRIQKNIYLVSVRFQHQSAVELTSECRIIAYSEERA